MSVIADKAWWKSKTIWTAVVVCVASIAGEFGIEIPDDDAEKMTTVGAAVDYIDGK